MKLGRALEFAGIVARLHREIGLGRVVEITYDLFDAAMAFGDAYRGVVCDRPNCQTPACRLANAARTIHGLVSRHAPELMDLRPAFVEPVEPAGIGSVDGSPASDN